MKTVVSTKILNQSQKKTLVETGFNVIDFDFIQTNSIAFELEISTDFGIITSKNALKSCLLHPNFKDLFIQKSFFCVGAETKKEVEKAGFNVVETANYGLDLATLLVQKYSSKSFTFFSGNLRRNELPKMLLDAKINFTEIEVYKTIKTPLKIEQTFDFLLFFSPSGVESFVEKNTIENQKCIAIGTTTAQMLENYTSNIYIAKQPSVAQVIQKMLQISDD